MDKVATIIVGGGVIGLAIAARLSHSRTVVVIEKEPHFGMHTSSRNSEVIHAGLYYPPGSLKQQLCVEGKAMLYQRCKTWHIPYKQLGKVLLATNLNEQQKLAEIAQNARLSGVNDLAWLSRAERNDKLYMLNCVSALHSPSTGIINSHQLMLSLLGELEQNGGVLVTNTHCDHIERGTHEFKVATNSHGERFTLACEQLINAAGLEAPCVYQNSFSELRPPKYHAYYCRGRYYRYQGKHPFSKLLYPVPSEYGLGVHATLDLDGQLKFGPDTAFIDRIDYTFDESTKAEFVSAIERYWPSVSADRLTPDYTGIRPKLSLDKNHDFVIESHQQHGISGLINLFGIESPGLTASLAIARYVEQLLAWE
ncbi:NAD(P)/FAD-dependent oxidoreductase [Pseudoalteromonas sp. T1lg65]|uniref:NAD(P)/FAD-dependent oxidoreductase n=1 Tax=Pseudoalteromonas sp. T1lg65 TaxID=2077101 RepID=UPI003F7B34A3